LHGDIQEFVRMVLALRVDDIRGALAQAICAEMPEADKLAFRSRNRIRGSAAPMLAAPFAAIRAVRANARPGAVRMARLGLTGVDRRAY